MVLAIVEEGQDNFHDDAAQHFEVYPNGTFQYGHYVIMKDILTRPSVLLITIASVVAVIGGAIRVTRMSTSSSDSYHAFVSTVSKVGFRKKLASVGPCICACFTWIKGIPRRFWGYYIEAFLIPSHRKEWGKYKTWSYESEKRPPKSSLLRDHLRINKALKRDAQDRTRRPRAVPHCHSDCQRIRINVSGEPFETQLRTLERFPDTLLGNAEKRIQYYNPKTEEYYFERCPRAFDVILYFYQSGGRFCRPDNVPSDLLLEDGQFFEISQAVLDQFRAEEGLAAPNTEEILPKGLFKRKLFLIFDVPESSFPAKIISFVSIFALFLSLCLSFAESLEVFRLKDDNDDSNDDDEYDADKDEFSSVDPLDPFFITDAACNVWFIFELLCRLLTCPILSQFVKNFVNIVDFLAVIPYIVDPTILLIRIHILGHKLGHDDDDDISVLDSLALLRVIRLIRVFRIFKLSRHSKGLKVLGRTLKASMNELILLIFFIFLGIILFSSAVYFLEMDDEKTKFDSIPEGFWWAVITLTTVGYGDMVPKTIGGKIVGSVCAVAGVLTIALPVPVIVSNFNYFYHQAVDEHDLKWININHVPSCPFRPAGNFTGVTKNYSKPKKGSKEEEQEVYSSDEDFGSLKKGA